MKEIIGKKKRKYDACPKQAIVEQSEINKAQSIADNFNKYFVNGGPGLASEISESEIRYRSNLP